MSSEESYESNLPLLLDVIDSISRKRRLSGDEAEDFTSWAITKVIENEYALFRKFEGRSSLKTYLNISVHRLFLDYRTHKWGKFQASVTAKQLGPDGVLLERYVYRDGLTAEEAVQVLRVNHRSGKSERELRAIVAQLPFRVSTRRRWEPEDGMDRFAAPDSGPEKTLLDSETNALRLKNAKALCGVLSQLTQEERVMVKMRFADGRQLREIAKALGLPEKGFYRAFERLRKRLRRDLEGAGVGRNSLSMADERTDWGENLLEDVVSSHEDGTHQ